MKHIVPKYEITFSTKARQIGLKLHHASESRQFSQKYRFDTEAYERALGYSLPTRLADLLDIASSVYLGDRLALRWPRKWFDPERRHWKRELHLILPVRDLSFWRNPVILEQLTAVLDYATEDRWNFIFKPLYLSNEPSQIDIAFQVPQDTHMALFSGGLDAFAGAFAHLKKYRLARTDLISVVTNPRMRGVQRRQIDALKDKLHLFENGIGALNLPMADFQIGTDNTRATSPLALLEISKLLSLVFEKSFKIENLAQWSTKAELCQALLDSSLRNTIKHTVSCDGSFSRRVRRKRQCGVCTSCLLRRQSLTAAGLSEYDFVEDYQFDVFKTSKFQNANRLFAFKAMQNQVQTIKGCLQAPNPWLALGVTYPILEEVKLRMSDFSETQMQNLQQKILRLYSTYLHEWSTFESQIN